MYTIDLLSQLTHPPPHTLFKLFLKASTGEAASVDNIEEKNKNIDKNYASGKKTWQNICFLNAKLQNKDKKEILH